MHSCHSLHNLFVHFLILHEIKITKTVGKNKHICIKITNIHTTLAMFLAEFDTWCLSQHKQNQMCHKNTYSWTMYSYLQIRRVSSAPSPNAQTRDQLHGCFTVYETT